MKGLGDTGLVLGLSLAVHAGAFAWFGTGLPQGGGAGAEGASSLAVAASDPSYQALAEAWQRGPSATDLPAAPNPPNPVTAPVLPQRSEAPTPSASPPDLTAPLEEPAPREPLAIAPRVAEGPGAVQLPTAEVLPDISPVHRDNSPAFAEAPTLAAATIDASPAAPLPIAPTVPDAPERPEPETADRAPAVPPTRELTPSLAAPDTPAVPEIGTAPTPPSDAPPGLAASPRPVSRPFAEPTPLADATPSDTAPTPARPAQTAAGTGGGSSQGSSTTDSAPSPGPPDPALIASWGGQIAARIAAAVPQVEATGQVTLQITVARNGRLQSVAILRSSGNGSLDQAAIRVVRRAGRFPRAPSGLSGESFRFNIPLRFT